LWFSWSGQLLGVLHRDEYPGLQAREVILGQIGLGTVLPGDWKCGSDRS